MTDEELRNVINLMEKLGYRFLEPKLLFTALCHSSYVHEQKQKGRNNIESNERLEFLGDSVAEILVSDYLYKTFSNYSEGAMAKIKAAIASEEALSQIAKDMGLGNFVFLGKGEEMTGGRDRDSILSDTLEAFIGAIYIDGGFEAVRRVVFPYFEHYIKEIADGKIVFDHKTALQEITQARFKTLPKYVLVKEEGPSHMKRFTVELRVKRRVLAVGEGSSIKEAEKAAAKIALERLKKEEKY